MLFDSMHFAYFLPLVVLVHYLTPAKWRWLSLVIASCYFYMAFIPSYILILFSIILIDFFAAIAMEQTENANTKKALLALSVISNLAILASFKYFNFFADSLNQGLGLWGIKGSPIHLSWVLPIGLSFHTFQSIAYTVEVYRGRFAAERHLGVYALYVLFFPQMVAGPIERPGHLLPQLRRWYPFDYSAAVAGSRLILVGLVKKVLVADNLSSYVDMVFSQPQRYSALCSLIAVYFFSFQIYCDFSGYSDIARGAAKFFGIDLALNFRNPYFSTDIGDFWRRWHITLSSWFRDYLYIPLGGNQVPFLRQIWNLIVVFLLSGLWHGANWTFLVWGFLHALFLIAYNFYRKLRFPALPPWIGALLTFHVVSFAWIFFRAASVDQAWSIISRFFVWNESITGSLTQMNLTPIRIIGLVGFLTCVFGSEWLFEFKNGKALFTQWPAVVRWSFYYAALIFVFSLGQLNGQDFIYFQF